MGFVMVAPGDAEACMAGIRNSPSRAICRYMQHCAHIDFTLYDGVIFTHCCSSAERLFDVVQYRNPGLFLHMMELPSRMDKEGKKQLAGECHRLFQALERRFGARKSPPPRLLEMDGMDGTVWVFGNSLHPLWKEAVQKVFLDEKLVFSDCRSSRHGDHFLDTGDLDGNCPHMLDFLPWFSRKLERDGDSIRAVIGVSSPKCDFSLFAMPQIKQICQEQRRPVLLLEEEFGPSLSEQNRIRLEAFWEILGKTGRAKRKTDKWKKEGGYGRD